MARGLFCPLHRRADQRAEGAELSRALDPAETRAAPGCDAYRLWKSHHSSATPHRATSPTRTKQKDSLNPTITGHRSSSPPNSSHTRRRPTRYRSPSPNPQTHIDTTVHPHPTNQLDARFPLKIIATEKHESTQPPPPSRSTSRRRRQRQLPPTGQRHCFSISRQPICSAHLQKTARGTTSFLHHHQAVRQILHLQYHTTSTQSARVRQMINQPRRRPSPR